MSSRGFIIGDLPSLLSGTSVDCTKYYHRQFSGDTRFLIIFGAMRPWEHQVPPRLYKYVPPTRIDVLVDARTRFSQRSVFDDDRELQPDYAAFGTESEIWRFILRDGIELDSRIPPNVLAKLIATNPAIQEKAKLVVVRAMKSPDKFGLFCLTETSDSDRMWSDYAADGTGFVIGFDTANAGFGQLTTPSQIGKVSYSDDPYGTLLGTMETEGAAIFFRKRMKYAFEREWRSFRALNRLEERPSGVYLSPFDPASISEIIIRPGCGVEGEIRGLAKEDARYKHLQITLQEPPPPR